MSDAATTPAPAVPAVASPPAAAAPAATSPAPQAEGGDESGEQQHEGLTLRALVSSKEAGVIIGRGGATIATLRSESGTKAGVSKVVPGVADRILSIGGPVDGVAKAYSLVAATILENPGPSAGLEGAPAPATTATIRLLISHLLIGSVIGKGGARIRQIQDLSGARMAASKEMLPQSTERIVEVSGQPDAIRLAVAEIAKCLIEDWDRSQGTVLYHPGAEGGMNGAFGVGPDGQARLGAQFGGRRVGPGGNSFAPRRNDNFAAGAPAPQQRRPSGGESSDPNFREQKISIPSDMVGCIIGRAGTKINEIRRLSGSKITIAKVAHDETGERMFVISGLPENNEKALFLLYNQLESEKERRVQSVQDEDNQAEA